MQQTAPSIYNSSRFPIDYNKQRHLSATPVDYNKQRHLSTTPVDSIDYNKKRHLTTTPVGSQSVIVNAILCCHTFD